MNGPTSYKRDKQNSTGIRWLVRAASTLFVLADFVIVAALRVLLIEGGYKWLEH